YQNDPNGMPLRLLDENGIIKWEGHYSAFGLVDRVSVEAVGQPLRLQGQYFDDESGLCYNRHRYYDAVVGCFISSDPIGLDGGLNPYRFAPNVLGWIDPWGLSCAVLSARLARIARIVHNLSGNPRAIRQSTVAIARVRINGKYQLFAAGSGGRLNPAQRAELVRLGVPEGNIFHGRGVTNGFSQIENHAERIVLRNIPEGSSVVHWGISWGGLQRNLPCVSCRPYVLGT
ncbi:MAG: RHS domain-containing protein, partial [Peptococcaceae bacterium]|nr:RHS domain-containing protein [Peptococcaceae bacterium]